MWSQHPRRRSMCGSTGLICRSAKCGKLRGREKRGEFVSGAAFAVCGCWFSTMCYKHSCIKHSQTVGGNRIEQPCQNLQSTSSSPWKVTARQEWPKAGWKWVYCCCLSVSAVMWNGSIHHDQTPSRAQTNLILCQSASDASSTIHFCGGSVWLIPVHHFRLSRVYHIDSNPSSANDSGADFAKAFTVRPLILL